MKPTTFQNRNVSKLQYSSNVVLAMKGVDYVN